MTLFRLIQTSDGPRTRQGIDPTPGARCPHLVVDGDKFNGPGGLPRCLACRALWYPVEREHSWRAGEIEHGCRHCGETLHLVYRSVAEAGRIAPLCWAHTAPRGCERDTYLVEGYEHRFSEDMDWDWTMRINLRDFNRRLETA